MRATIPEYPWDQLTPYAIRAADHPDGAINLSVGSPVDETPLAAREALAAASDAHGYPTTAGTVQLRETIAAWLLRRRGVSVTPESVLPTIGAKESVSLLPFLLGLDASDAVVHPRIAYPSYAIGAELVGAEAVAADDPDDWPDHTKLVWLNSPANPTGTVLEVAALRAARERAHELGAVIVSDECYAEFAWQAPWDVTRVPSLLDPRVVGDNHRGALVSYSLSKQSNLAGYRAAFLAGDHELITRLLTLRKHAGLMMPTPVQAAMVEALNDDRQVARQQLRYRARREALIAALRAAGFRIDASEAGLYLWITRGVDAWQSVAELATLGIIVGPGHFYGAHATQHVRVALTASDADIAQAVIRLRQWAAQETLG